jgi:hypothetical protein
MCVQWLFQQWWFGDVIVPIVITMLFGGWVSLACGRLVWFNQTRLRAVDGALKVIALPLSENKGMMLHRWIEVNALWSSCGLDFAYQRQQAAAESILAETKRVSAAVRKELAELEMGAGFTPEQREKLGALFKTMGDEGFQKFNALSPNIIALFRIGLKSAK